MSLYLICFFNIQHVFSVNYSLKDTLYYEESDAILDSNDLDIKKRILIEIENKYLSKEKLTLIIIDGIPLNNTTDMFKNRDSISGKFWDGHCGCYSYFFENSYEDIKEIYYINSSFSSPNLHQLLIHKANKPIRSSIKKHEKNILL